MPHPGRKKKRYRLQHPELAKPSKTGALDVAKAKTNLLKAEIEEIEKENVQLRQKKLDMSMCKRKIGSVKLTKLRSQVQTIRDVNNTIEQQIECVERRIKLMTQQRSSLHIDELTQPEGNNSHPLCHMPILPPLIESSTLSLVNCGSFTISLTPC